MPYPGLVQEDHKILGSEYCSGYTDVFGKWNTGFYCPQTGSTSAVFCCGTPYLKYCCTYRPTLDDEDENEAAMLPYTVRIPVFFAIFCGVLAVVFLLITAICFFCSCCFVYKKRRDEASTGLYRIQGSSSTVSALASIYSNHNSSVVTTPLDTDWTSQLPVSSYIPYPFAQQSTPQLSSLSSYPSSAIIPNAHSNNSNNNNNNNIPAFYYNNLGPHRLTNNSNTHMNTNNNIANNSQFSSLSSLYQSQYHPSYQRPVSAQSTVSTYSSNSTFTLPSLPTQLSQLSQIQQNLRPLNPTGYTNLPRNQGYLYRPQAQNTLPHSMNSFLNPFCFPNGSGSNGQLQQNSLSQNGRPRQLNQQQQNGFQNQTSPYNNNNITTGRPRTQGNHLNQQQQERLATVQSLMSAYRASVNSAAAAVMRSRPASFNNSSDVNRLNEINLLFSTVLNQNRRPASGNGNGGGENANGVIRTSGESATTASTTTNINNSNAMKGNDSVLVNNENNVGIPPDSTLEETITRSVCLDANGNSNSDAVTSLPLSIDDNDDSKAKAVVTKKESNELEDPNVTIAIQPTSEVDSVKKSVSVPVPPEEPPASNCVELDMPETGKTTGSIRDGDHGDDKLRINEDKDVEKICNFDKVLIDLPNGGTRSLES